MSCDPVMRKLIETYSDPVWQSGDNLFLDLLDSIISQQLSVKAGSTIVKRFINLFENRPAPFPQEVVAKPDMELRGAGLSGAKVRYVKALSQAIIDNSLNLESLHLLSDSEVVKELTRVKGIGVWTAEMFLIFSLHREDVFSLGDLGLRSAVNRLYGIHRENLKEIEALSLSWSPYRSFAGRYLWKSLDNEPVSII